MKTIKKDWNEEKIKSILENIFEIKNLDSFVK